MTPRTDPPCVASPSNGDHGTVQSATPHTTRGSLRTVCELSCRFGDVLCVKFGEVCVHNSYMCSTQGACKVHGPWQRACAAALRFAARRGRGTRFHYFE